jgi:uncharacterized damage-inducible protein DinB
MRLAKKLVGQLISIYEGEAWHGTPLRRMLDDVDDARANARPIASARTIAELTAHVAAWMEIVERRLRGEEFDVTAEMDFPSVEGVTVGDAIARLDRAQAKLLETVRAMSDDELEANVAGKNYSNEFMLQGLAHHNTYHAAQMAMLKK